MSLFRRKLEPIKTEQASQDRARQRAKDRAERLEQLNREKAGAIEWARGTLVPVVNEALMGRGQGSKPIHSPYGEIIIGISQRGYVYVTTGGYLVGQALEALYSDYDVTTERIAHFSRRTSTRILDFPLWHDHCTTIRPIG